MLQLMYVLSVGGGSLAIDLSKRFDDLVVKQSWAWAHHFKLEVDKNGAHTERNVGCWTTTLQKLGLAVNSKFVELMARFLEKRRAQGRNFDS